MNEDEIRRKLKDAIDARQPSITPAFSAVWAGAEARFRRSRQYYRSVGGIVAAVAVMAIAAGLWFDPGSEPNDDYLIADAILNGTSWSAPSDTLMPEHQFDIYQEVSFLTESTNGQEGSLL
jgi:anti-sigma-K factor RskA